MNSCWKKLWAECVKPAEDFTEFDDVAATYIKTLCEVFTGLDTIIEKIKERDPTQDTVKQLSLV